MKLYTKQKKPDEIKWFLKNNYKLIIQYKKDLAAKVFFVSKFSYFFWDISYIYLVLFDISKTLVLRSFRMIMFRLKIKIFINTIIYKLYNI